MLGPGNFRFESEAESDWIRNGTDWIQTSIPFDNFHKKTMKSIVNETTSP